VILIERTGMLLTLVGFSILCVTRLVGAQTSGSVSAGVTSAPAGVADPQRTWQNWTLNCQGCHRPDGGGSAGTAPALAGSVGRFLSVPNGRNCLVRVPGVATSALPNGDLAELLNWMLWKFDKDHVPVNFQPFTETEVGRLRTRPLRSNPRGGEQRF
jgi:hypothetical protein